MCVSVCACVCLCINNLTTQITLEPNQGLGSFIAFDHTQSASVIKHTLHLVNAIETLHCTLMISLHPPSAASPEIAIDAGAQAISDTVQRKLPRDPGSTCHLKLVLHHVLFVCAVTSFQRLHELFAYAICLVCFGSYAFPLLFASPIHCKILSGGITCIGLHCLSIVNASSSRQSNSLPRALRHQIALCPFWELTQLLHSPCGRAHPTDVSQLKPMVAMPSKPCTLELINLLNTSNLLLNLH